MKTACEMTTEEYIAAIGGRNEEADYGVHFEASKSSFAFLCDEIVTEVGEYLICRCGHEFHAFEKNEDMENSEEKSVGYFIAEKSQTTLAVANGHEGRGLGFALLCAFRKSQPLYKSGGLSEGGYRLNVKFHKLLLAGQI